MRLKTSLPVLFILTASCFEIAEFDGIVFRQYADHVISFSSQYTTTSWSAARTLGKENVYPDYGDNSNAWSPLTADDNREFLVLGFDTAQTVITIEIYETWYPGAIDTVYLRNSKTGKWETIYSKPAEQNPPETVRIKSIYLVETQYLADAIRIAINSEAVTDDPNTFGWNEIDAVAITGKRKKP